MVRLTHQDLISKTDYNPLTGEFPRLNCKTNDRTGYVQATLNGKLEYAHRLAWLYVHGYLPTEEIDHVNGIKTDNRIENLRLASHRENCLNRVCHRKGKIPYISQLRKDLYQVQINVRREIGGYVRRNFKTLREAIEFRDSILDSLRPA